MPVRSIYCATRTSSNPPFRRQKDHLSPSRTRPILSKAAAARVVKEVEKDGGKLTSTVVRRHVDKELGVSTGN